MPLLKQILPAVIIAMVVAAGVCSLALLSGKESARRALGPLAVGLGYCIGHLVVTGWVTFPPTDTTNWLPYFALIAAALGATWEWGRWSLGIRGLLLAMVTAGALRLLLQPKFKYG